MMSTQLASALSNLRAAIAPPNTDDNGLVWTDAFHAALDRVTALDDPASVAPLLLMLDDEHEFQDVLWSLLHAAEHFPAEPNLAGLLQAVPTLAARSPEWATRLTGRVLNSAVDTRALAQALLRAPPGTKAAFGGVFRHLKRDNPKQFGKSVDEIAASIDET